jgi:uncharacterized membrane protein
VSAGPEGDPRAPERFEPGTQLERLIFFSDAVFAIAITLLVIDIRLPDLAGEPGGPAAMDVLASLAGRIVTFVLSFAVVGLYWTGHHRIFAAVRDFDGRVVVLNLAFLLFVAFIPFPTAFLGAYGNEPAGPVVYALTNAAASLVELVLWLYLDRAGFLDRSLPPRYIAYRVAHFLRSPAVFLGSIPIAILVNPFLAELSWAAFIPLGLLIRWAFRDASKLQPERRFR